MIAGIQKIGRGRILRTGLSKKPAERAEDRIGSAAVGQISGRVIVQIGWWVSLRVVDGRWPTPFKLWIREPELKVLMRQRSRDVFQVSSGIDSGRRGLNGPSGN